MTSVGMLSAGFAHDLATPLAAVVANLDHIRVLLESAAGAARKSGWDGEEVRVAIGEASDVVADALSGANLAVAILRDLRAFSHPVDGTHGPVDLRGVVERAIRLVGPALRERARLVTELDDAPMVLGSESLLIQVLVDLLVNAAQAIPAAARPEGIVTVAVRTEDCEVILEVRDTGTGIPDTALPRIFEPFFTTKSADAGTGLGLWICRQIVSAHGGRIRADSALGRGTRMEVRLPTYGRPLPPAGASEQKSKSTPP